MSKIEPRANEQEFAEEAYLEANPDVAAAVNDGRFINGHEHYEAYGKREGRALNTSRGMFGKNTREAKVFHLLDVHGAGLEIGPSHNPLAPKKKGYNVHIVDHVSAAELRAKYQKHGVDLDNIEEVDFVWHGEPYPILIGKTNCYDWIIASHVIEHVPNPISFLQQCEALLKPDGILSLVIPDKRFCFDCLSPASSTGNVLDAYTEERTRPSHGQIFDCVANAAQRKGNIVWGDDMLGGPDELLHTFASAKAHWEKSRASEEYFDVHCWRFTPSSFRLVVSDLQGLALISLEIKAEFGTTGCEFYVSLGKNGYVPVKSDRFLALSAMKVENA